MSNFNHGIAACHGCRFRSEWTTGWALICSAINDSWTDEGGQLISTALATCASAETRRVYRVQLVRFRDTGLPLSRDGVARYIQQLRKGGMSSSSVAVAVAAVRKLAGEAVKRGLITGDEFNQLMKVGPGRVAGTRTATFLTVENVKRLLALPDRGTYWGKRDGCVLSLMLGCGLRRSEVASLRWNQFRQISGRVYLDSIGTGCARRVPVPVWVQKDAQAWYAASREEPPPGPRKLRHLERSRPRDFVYVAGGMGGDAVHELAGRYGTQLGLDLTPGSLRRALARMLRDAGAPLEQVQYTLGHHWLATTICWSKA